MNCKWTEEDIRFLRENFCWKTSREMAGVLGRTAGAVKKKLYSLGLRKKDVVGEAWVNPGYFKKGCKPWNKGLKGIHISPKTEFKKGHQPWLEKWDGCITVRKGWEGKKVKFIRLAPGRWEYYHRYLWEKKYGEIPKDKVVVPKKGDYLGVERVEDLKLVDKVGLMSRRNNLAVIRQMWAENKFFESDKYVAVMLERDDEVLRKKILKEYPELIELKRQSLILNRELKKHEAAEAEEC